MRRESFALIVGGGRLGRMLAENLSRAQEGVVLMDRQEEALRHLGPEFSGFRLVGDARELGSLREARIDRASTVVAVTDDDTLNAFVAIVAKAHFQIPRVLARIKDPSKADLLQSFQVQTMNPVNMVAERFLAELTRRDP